MFKFSKKGFSLLDVIFATGIILAGLVGVSALMWRITISARYSADRFIAANLTQEGIEIIRAIRDTNWVADGNPDWNQGLEISGNYHAVYNSSSLTPCGGACPALRYDSATGYYGNSGTVTKFTRIISLQNSGDKISVGSIVEWDGYSMTVEDELYDWMPD